MKTPKKKQPASTRAIGITQPPDWWERWREAADKAGKSLSEWIGDACNRLLAPKVRSKLSKRVKAGGYRRTEKAKKPD